MTSKLNRFVHKIKNDQLNLLSARVLRNGNLIAQWDRDQDARRLQHSISKSFTCMAVGLAIEEGLLHLNSTLGEYFTYDNLPSISETFFPPQQLTLGDLLRMSSGHNNPPLHVEERASLEEKDWVKYYMSLPLDRMPGEQFTYSSGDTFMISALFQAATGQTVKDYLTPRLFEPLGIHDVDWETSPLGVTLGCAGLWISNEELSRFGQLLLQEGNWRGQQLIPAEWIRSATRRQIMTSGAGDWGKGYGYQFWMCSHDAYRADGAHGQLCIILPAQQAVISINSEEDQMQQILDAVWTEILPILSMC
ncbi:serine hydrolase [Paenibacillus sp. MER 99-2]|uniref:serine hydrolase domain-containing protein n=1 Tax=Paenibacillus sp. MER 99-2 TaxID=2939572 RepID=UPI00203BDF63|nr:serine hydrolase [Paenibacillus sp. MER 99-2]MCM3173195.1 beta-lactamase family protein [Paenibacillus sp. MER 99-2]